MALANHISGHVSCSHLNACIVWVSTCLPHMQGEPEILQVLNSFSTDQARIEALTSDSSKKRTRETPIVGRT